jgi:hypothetical protein
MTPRIRSIEDAYSAGWDDAALRHAPDKRAKELLTP